ncbi:MAG: PD-(D/E)XK nuclease domain-containing protein [Clostridiales bacterium]|jgi:hypothetical protein|nr:PD-(D/E)XK nuclease domain-containing protein [Clostridiales bacterium]
MLPLDYWANTKNSIVKELVDRHGATEKERLEALIRGESITARISEDLTYDTIYFNRDNLWSFMLHTGYLKPVLPVMNGSFVELAIPNLEVRNIFIKSVREWFEATVAPKHRQNLAIALSNDDPEAIQSEISAVLFETISYWDEAAEGFFHGFMIALLESMKGWRVKSNMEKGLGRPDAILVSERKQILFEFKAKKSDSVEKQIDEGVDQIRRNKNIEGAIADGAKIVVAYAIAFANKSCIVKKVSTVLASTV